MLAGKEVAGKQSPELLNDWAKAVQPTLEGSANRVVLSIPLISPATQLSCGSCLELPCADDVSAWWSRLPRHEQIERPIGAGFLLGKCNTLGHWAASAVFWLLKLHALLQDSNCTHPTAKAPAVGSLCRVAVGGTSCWSRPETFHGYPQQFQQRPNFWSRDLYWVACDDRSNCPGCRDPGTRPAKRQRQEIGWWHLERSRCLAERQLCRCADIWCLVGPTREVLYPSVPIPLPNPSQLQH